MFQNSVLYEVAQHRTQIHLVSLTEINMQAELYIETYTQFPKSNKINSLKMIIYHNIFLTLNFFHILNQL
jgi:hypothetical protein